MTDRKITCSACKSAMTKADIESNDLEFDGELKATNQPEYTADADTDLVATVGTLDEYTPMVRTSGKQSIGGVKTFTSDVIVSTSTNDARFNAIENRTSGSETGWMAFFFGDNIAAWFNVYKNSDNSTGVLLKVKNADGTTKQIVLSEGDRA